MKTFIWTTSPLLGGTTTSGTLQKDGNSFNFEKFEKWKTYDFEPEEDEELELEDEADLVRPFASGEATKLCLCSTRFNLGVPPLETTLFSSLRSKYVPNLVQQAPIFFSFFPLEIEVRNRHRAPKQQHNHSSQQAQAHHHAVTTQTLSRLTHTHSGKIGRGTFSAQATSQHSATIVLQCIAVISDFNKILINSLFQISRYLIYTLCLWKLSLI